MEVDRGEITDNRGCGTNVPSHYRGKRAAKDRKVIDGYTGFPFYDDDKNLLVAMYWQYRFNHMVSRYNGIYWVQMPNITLDVCRHTYCSNQAKAGMNPKSLQ